MTTEKPFWAREQLQLRRRFENWVKEEIERYEQKGFKELFGEKGGHALDEAGGYTRSFVGAYCLSGNENIVSFMKKFRDDWEQALSASGHFYHGYDANEDGDYITHTAEAYTQFLLNLLYLDISDEKTIKLVDDGAEHLGNWHSDVKDWYDWENSVFLSYFLGTRSPYHRPPYDFQTPRHFRVLQIALAAYEATGRERYLKLCEDYCQFYMRGILAAENEMDIPTSFYLITPEELEKYKRDEEFRESYRFRYYSSYPEPEEAQRRMYRLEGGRPCIPYSFIGDLNPPYHVLHDLMMTWLEIYKHSPRAEYRETLGKVMSGWIKVGKDMPSQIAGFEPHCGVHYPKYRDFTGDRSLDEVYLSRWPQGACSYLLAGDEDRLLGVASRADAIFEQSLQRNRGVFGDQFATDHACNAISIPGTTSAYVAPALFMPAFGGLNVHYGRAPWVRVLYYHEQGIGLPQDVAAIYVPETEEKSEGVKLANLGSQLQKIALRQIRPETPENLILTAPAPDGLKEVAVEPGDVVEVTFNLSS